MKNIYVVLTRTNTVLSKIIGTITNSEYTHASISLDNNFDKMYSFGRKNVYNPFIGTFVIENFNEGVFGIHECLHGKIIELEITNKQYDSIKKLINNFIINKNYYKYNYLGLIDSLIERESYSEKSFLCSEFVYYILYSNDIINFNIPRNLVKPEDFKNLNGKIIFEGDLKEIYAYCNHKKYLQPMYIYF